MRAEIVPGYCRTPVHEYGSAWAATNAAPELGLNVCFVNLIRFVALVFATYKPSNSFADTHLLAVCYRREHFSLAVVQTNNEILRSGADQNGCVSRWGHFLCIAHGITLVNTSLAGDLPDSVPREQLENVVAHENSAR